VWWGYTLLQNEKKRDLAPQAVLRLAAQESTVDWGPVYVPPPPKFQLILSGTAPAAMVSMTLRPHADVINRRTLWDPVWFAIHEAAAIAFWFFIGCWIDSGHRTLVRTMWIYLCARVIFAVLSIVLGMATPGAALQSLFWLALLIYSFIRGFGWMIRRAGEFRSPGTGREAHPH
jgi:hypothetical protein